MQKKACEQFAKFEFSWNSQNYSKKFDACIPEKSQIFNCLTLRKKKIAFLFCNYVEPGCFNCI